MAADIDLQIAGLAQMTPTELRCRYAELFGEPTRVGNKSWLIKRIAWRLQSIAEGGLSERARRRAEALACDADLRLSPPTGSGAAATTEPAAPRAGQDARLPSPGTIIHRRYHRKVLEVLVLEGGFRFEGQIYRSLSAVAKTITGSHCNGFLFFGLAPRRRRT